MDSGLGLGLVALGRHEGEIVDAGGHVDRLAHAAGVLDEGHLVAVRGIGIARGEAAAVGAYPGRPRNCQAVPLGATW